MTNTKYTNMCPEESNNDSKSNAHNTKNKLYDYYESMAKAKEVRPITVTEGILGPNHYPLKIT